MDEDLYISMESYRMHVQCRYQEGLKKLKELQEVKEEEEKVEDKQTEAEEITGEDLEEEKKLSR